MAGNSTKRSAKADDTNPQSKRQRAGEEDVETSQPRLACPFHRREPHVYCATRASKYFKTCASGGFKDTHRVKEHIQRTHLTCIQCNRCGTVFSTVEKLQAHQRAKQPCQRIDSLPHFTTLTDEQAEQLKRKTRTTKTEQEKWNTIYATVFPNELIPSAFDLSREESDQAIRTNEVFHLEGYAKFRLHSILADTLQTSLGSSQPNSLAISQPTSLANSQPTSPDAARLFHLLPSAIDASLTQLFAEYRHTTSMLTDMVTTPATTNAVTPTTHLADRGSGSASSGLSELDPSNSPLWTAEEFNSRMQGMESLGAGVASNFPPSSLGATADVDVDVFGWLNETALNVHGE